MTSQDAHQPVTTAETSQARSELAEYLQVSRRQHKLFPRAALVGLCAAAVAVAFRALISVAAMDALTVVREGCQNRLRTPKMFIRDCGAVVAVEKECAAITSLAGKAPQYIDAQPMHAIVDG